MAKLRPQTVVAITGNEDTLRLRALDRAIEAPQKAGWQIDRINVEAKGDVTEVLSRGSLFASEAHTLVVVDSPEKEDVSVYQDHKDTGEDDIVLLLHYDGHPAGNTKFGKFVASLGKQHTEYSRPDREWELPDYLVKFVTSEAKLRGKTITEALALELIEAVGSDLGVLSLEILKLSALLDSEGATDATRLHLKGSVASFQETPVSILRDALQSRQAGKVADALNRIRKGQKEDPTIQVVRQLAPAVLSWIVTLDMSAKGLSPTEIALAAGIKSAKGGWVVSNKILPALKRWSGDDLAKVAKGMAAADLAQRSNVVDAWTLLRVCLLDACAR